MTAEIALVNRSAPALAADSAATLRIGAKSKTYNTAEKIFEFSCNQPIALMIYNNVEHVGVPLDVLIRKHRSECSQIFESMEAAADEFLDYLLKFPRKNNQDGIYLAAILVDIYGNIYRRFVRIARRFMSAKALGKPIEDVNPQFEAILDEQITKYDDSKLEGYLADKTLAQFLDTYGDACDQAISTAFNNIALSDNHRNKLLVLAFAIVRSSIGSDLLTGMVFGGFGKNDLFPTLHYFEIDGTYFGKQKILNRNEVDIDRAGERAAIVPFAQSDMAERFIYGIDGDLTGAIGDFVRDVVDEIASTKPGTFTDIELEAIKDIVQSGFDDTLGDLIDTEKQDLLDIVNFMSKKEMGEMAHALVELTSAKRRFSTAQETVGGPIDVAIVSRSEGFIWIQRKHYFEQDVNPGFFTRVFPKRQAGEVDGVEAGGPEKPRRGSRPRRNG